jgi:hypothetical protein
MENWELEIGLKSIPPQYSVSLWNAFLHYKPPLHIVSLPNMWQSVSENPSQQRGRGCKGLITRFLRYSHTYVVGRLDQNCNAESTCAFWMKIESTRRKIEHEAVPQLFEGAWVGVPGCLSVCLVDLLRSLEQVGKGVILREVLQGSVKFSLNG